MVYEFLEILPRLHKEVVVHVHDILLPQHYCRNWYEQKFFWDEQYLLQAFLTMNDTFQVLWAGQYMHLNYPDELAKAFPSYTQIRSHRDAFMREWGHKSFWMQRIK